MWRERHMRSLTMMAAALATAIALPAAPVWAGKKPPVTEIACDDTYSPEIKCFYSTQHQCWEARRALHRTKPAYLSPCFFDELHPEYGNNWALVYIR
jgi:hypothetical protein